MLPILSACFLFTVTAGIKPGKVWPRWIIELISDRFSDFGNGTPEFEKAEQVQTFFLELKTF